MMSQIKNQTDLDVALKEYELATQHYWHEDKMKTDALRNSILSVIAIMTAVTTIISSDFIKNVNIKYGFSVIMGLFGSLISFSYGMQYQRILKYQEAREARLEELERIIEKSNYFAIRTIRYGLQLMETKNLSLCENKFKRFIKIESLESWSSSKSFKLLLPWFLLFLWVMFLIVVYLYRS